jgi:hypothetical protein
MRWLFAALVAACGPASSDGVVGDELCGNGIDDDGNGLIDCADDACASICPEICGDSLDNDSDGLADCEDADCDGSCTEACGDGRDNDGDGLIDCADQDCSVPECPEICTDGRDNDGDGASDCSDLDCNDPSCTELCTDARDNDGDGAVDCDDPDCDGDCPENCEDARDNDGDGLIDCSDPQCEVICIEDCTNGVDDDGDGVVDCVDPECEASCDTDSDGFLNGDHGGDDCDDLDPFVNPEADEVCNGFDDDCNGLVDEDDPDLDFTTLTAWFPDEDGDGYGYRPAGFEWACVAPPDTVANDTDCNDTNPEIHSAAIEVCDGLDNDCDGLRDHSDPSVDLSTATTWYPDDDGDGFGDPAGGVEGCNPPPGTVDNADDCDDSDPLLGTSTDWLPDLDGDDYGLGVPFGVASCTPPAGAWAAETHGEDCDDADPANHPNGIEICDGGDNDCDALVDDEDDSLDLLSATEWHPDEDGDGFGDPRFDDVTCIAPDGWVDDATDCDDFNADVHVGASEICNGLDDDCDGRTDDDDPSVDLSTATDWFSDADGDGYGDPALPGPFSCSQPGAHYAPNDLDCDDSDPALSDVTEWVVDIDGDGFGSGDVSDVVGCVGPGDPWVSLQAGEDCNDFDATIYPGAFEVCEDGIDQDCLGGDKACYIGIEGPDFSADGYRQCAGYFDTAGGPSDIPAKWAPDCREADDNETRLVCGLDLTNYRWIDISQNPWRDKLPAYPTIGWITDDNFGHTHKNQIYATGNDPDVGQSWWGTGDGCSEFAANTTVNNFCSWEASNCFGAGLTGDRYLWVYARP